MNDSKEWRDTHNDLMWVLTATGLAGGVFFIGGLWLCGWGAWKGRRGPAGPLPVALMLTLMVIIMTGSLHRRKPFWLILSMGAASGAAVAGPRSPKIVRQPTQGYLRR
jgi:O-antigen ligase